MTLTASRQMDPAKAAKLRYNQRRHMNMGEIYTHFMLAVAPADLLSVNNRKLEAYRQIVINEAFVRSSIYKSRHTTLGQIWHANRRSRKCWVKTDVYN